MKDEVLEQVAGLLAGELEGEADDLDSLENQLTEVLRRVGQQALQVKLEGKKGATQAAASPVRAIERPASLGIGPRRS